MAALGLGSRGRQCALNFLISYNRAAVTELQLCFTDIHSDTERDVRVNLVLSTKTVHLIRGMMARDIVSLTLAICLHQAFYGTCFLMVDKPGSGTALLLK